MKKLITLFIALLALPAVALAGLEVGQPVPEVTGVDSNGNPFKLSTHKGGSVVLEWTNHQCPFVVKHYKNGDMQKLQETYTAKGVKWVRVISSAPGKQGHLTPVEANEIAAKQGVKATATLLDESGEIGKLFDAKTTPHMFVIDKEGVLAYQGAIDSIRSTDSGDIALATPHVANALDSLLAGTEVRLATTTPYGCSVKY
jgi:peroxiredoxin